MWPLLLAWCGCTYIPKPPPLGSAPPVLEACYASPQAAWGETWKVYLKGYDADGDLWEARFNINQLGVTYDSADSYSVLNQEYWTGFDGYFFLRIPDRNLWSGRINLVLSVVLIDRGGLKSQEILVPLKVGSQPGDSPPPGFADRPVAPIRHVLRPS